MSTLKTHNLQSPDAGSVNITLAPNAGMVVAGLSTYSNQINVGSNIKLGTAGVVTATSFVGSGANLTSLPAQATIANNADNRVITGGSGVNLNGESSLTFDGSTLVVTPTSSDARVTILGSEGNDARLSLISDDGDDHIDQYNLRVAASNNRFYIDQFESGAFQERFTIANGGNIGIGGDQWAKLVVTSQSTNTSLTGHNYLASQSGMSIDLSLIHI